MNPLLQRRRTGDRARALFVPWFAALGAVSFFLTAELSLAQEAGSDTIYTRQPVFRIPFQAEPGERRLKQVQLYVSTDQGRSWHPYANVRPEEGSFIFTATRDGHYWFTVRTVDFDNRGNPLTMDNARAGLKVCVDTQPPRVLLKALPPRENMSVVEWDIRDENLDLTSLNYSYRAQGGQEWLPLRVEPAAVGQYSWRPAVQGTIEVRLHARDRAGNENEARTSALASGDNHDHASAGAEPNKNSPISLPSGATVRIVNSKRISIQYELKEVGPSGVSVVELWYTQDGRNWQKYSEDPNHRPPYSVDVNGEGLYGFSLVVKSGVGLGDRPPQVGDPPQVWVEVDLTKPNVSIHKVEVGRGSESGKLNIAWTAADKNLGKQPITLAYAEQAAGPWTQIAANLENSGRHTWTMPSGIPYRFFIRIEVSDRAGNAGTADWAQPVIVDLAQPKSVILNVEPGK